MSYYIKEACISIAQKVADGKVPPRKEPDDGDGGWLRPKEVGLFKHVDPVYGEQHRAKFEATMAAGRELHEAEKVAGDAVEHKLLMESLGKPTPRPEGERTPEGEGG
jgi:hypothetical protein